MSLFAGVTITIYQNGSVVDTLTTDSNGYGATTINAGYYTLTFTYPDRAPSSFDMTINHNNTYLVFAFPYYEVAGSQITSSPSFTQVGDMPITASEAPVTATPVFDNTAP